MVGNEQKGAFGCTVNHNDLRHRKKQMKDFGAERNGQIKDLVVYNLTWVKNRNGQASYN